MPPGTTTTQAASADINKQPHAATAQPPHAATAQQPHAATAPEPVLGPSPEAAVARLLSEECCNQLPSARVTTLRAFVRLMRRQHVLRQTLEAAGATSQPARAQSLTCLCRDCANTCFLAVVYEDSSDEPSCLECAVSRLQSGSQAAMQGASAAGATQAAAQITHQRHPAAFSMVVLWRRCLPEIEALCQHVEGAVCGLQLAAESALGNHGLTEAVRFKGSVDAALQPLAASFEWGTLEVDQSDVLPEQQQAQQAQQQQQQQQQQSQQQQQTDYGTTVPRIAQCLPFTSLRAGIAAEQAQAVQAIPAQQASSLACVMPESAEHAATDMQVDAVAPDQPDASLPVQLQLPRLSMHACSGNSGPALDRTESPHSDEVQQPEHAPCSSPRSSEHPAPGMSEAQAATAVMAATATQATSQEASQAVTAAVVAAAPSRLQATTAVAAGVAGPATETAMSSEAAGAKPPAPPSLRNCSYWKRERRRSSADGAGATGKGADLPQPSAKRLCVKPTGQVPGPSPQQQQQQQQQQGQQYQVHQQFQLLTQQRKQMLQQNRQQQQQQQQQRQQQRQQQQQQMQQQQRQQQQQQQQQHQMQQQLQQQRLLQSRPLAQRRSGSVRRGRTGGAAAKTVMPRLHAAPAAPAPAAAVQHSAGQVPGVELQRLVQQQQQQQQQQGYGLCAPGWAPGQPIGQAPLSWPQSGCRNAPGDSSAAVAPDAAASMAHMAAMVAAACSPTQMDMALAQAQAAGQLAAVPPPLHSLLAPSAAGPSSWLLDANTAAGNHDWGPYPASATHSSDLILLGLPAVGTAADVAAGSVLRPLPEAAGPFSDVAYLLAAAAAGGLASHAADEASTWQGNAALGGQCTSDHCHSAARQDGVAGNCDDGSRNGGFGGKIINGGPLIHKQLPEAAAAVGVDQRQGPFLHGVSDATATQGREQWDSGCIVFAKCYSCTVANCWLVMLQAGKQQHTSTCTALQATFHARLPCSMTTEFVPCVAAAVTSQGSMDTLLQGIMQHAAQ